MDIMEMVDKLLELKKKDKSFTLKKKENGLYRRVRFYNIFAEVKIPVVEYSPNKTKSKWVTVRRDPLIIPQDCDLLL